MYKMCKTIQSSNVAENVDEESAVCIEEVISLSPTKSHKDNEELGLIDNSDMKDLVNYSESKKTVSSNYITCLTDSGTMSHIFKDEGLLPPNRKYVCQQSQRNVISHKMQRNFDSPRNIWNTEN